MDTAWPEGEEFFQKYDKDNNGKIDEGKLKALLVDLNGGKAVSDAEVREVMQASSSDETVGSYKVENLKIAIADWVSKTQRAPTSQSDVAKAAFRSAALDLRQAA